MKRIIIKKAENDMKFVGLKITDEVVSITFPIGYDILEKEFNIDDQELNNYYEDIKILLNSLEKSKDNYHEEGINKFSFSSAAFIIEYYLKYGEYNIIGSQTKYNGNGKIDWKKTITSLEPIYYNGYTIYNNYYSRISREQENIITQIQYYCLEASIKIIGWLYGIKDYKKNKNINLTENEMLYYLNKEIMSTNEDNKKTILNEMINFIKGSEVSKLIKNKDVTIGRFYFDKVWENILRSEIYRLYEKYDIMPNTFYQKVDGTIIENSNLIPDIVIKAEDKIIILDAKYYRVGTLPQTSDICKQIFYGDYIKSKNRKKEIINIFLLPNNIEKEYEYFGYAGTYHTDEVVHTYYLNTKKVLKNSNAIHEMLKNII